MQVLLPQGCGGRAPGHRPGLCRLRGRRQSARRGGGGGGREASGPSGGALGTCCSQGSASARSEPRRQRVNERLSACRSMEDVYEVLVERLCEHVANVQEVASSDDGEHDQAWPLTIGICGAPGSGKSTIAAEVCSRLNARLGWEAALVVPMDGFHYYRRELDRMEDPAAAHRRWVDRMAKRCEELLRVRAAAPDGGCAGTAVVLVMLVVPHRRGAPWTFNARAFVDRVASLRRAGEGVFPAFEHERKDPEEDAIEVRREHRVVLLEGNYLLLDEPVWEELRTRALVDEFWYVQVDLQEAMRRVRRRLVRENGESEASAQERVETNDALNARLVEQRCPPLAHLLVPSLPLF
eukprot:scaffold1900_cov389-Prasinococcus_capsulatus_cf.AAC.17